MTDSIHANQVFAVSQFNWGEEIPPQEYTYARDGAIVIWGEERPYRNRYPDKILDMYLKNANYRRIVEDTAQGIAGLELVCEGPQADQLQDMLHTIGVTTSYVKNLALQMAIFNGVASGLIWTKGTASGLSSTKLHSVKPLRVSQLRAAVPRSDSPIGDVSGYWLAADWRKVTDYSLTALQNNAYKPKFFPLYSPHNTRESSEVIYTIAPNPLTDYYPIPDAQSVYTELVIDNEITAFQANYIANGMVSSGIIYYPYRPKQTPQNAEKLSSDDENELRKVKSDLQKQLSGTRNSGKMTFIAYDPTIGGVSSNGQRTPIRPEFINPVDTNNDEKFIKMTDINREKMLTGLGVISQELVGISKKSGFTSQSELLVSAEKLTEQKVYAPKRDVILKHINQIVGIIGLDAYVTITPRRTFSQPYTVEMVTNGLISVNEWRESMGLATLNEDVVIDSETAEIEANNPAFWDKFFNFLTAAK